MKSSRPAAFMAVWKAQTHWKLSGSPCLMRSLWLADFRCLCLKSFNVKSHHTRFLRRQRSGDHCALTFHYGHGLQLDRFLGDTSIVALNSKDSKGIKRDSREPTSLYHLRHILIASERRLLCSEACENLCFLFKLDSKKLF